MVQTSQLTQCHAPDDCHGAHVSYALHGRGLCTLFLYGHTDALLGVTHVEEIEKPCIAYGSLTRPFNVPCTFSCHMLADKQQLTK